MNVREVAPKVGAVVCVATALVLAAPFVLIEGHGELLGDYYAAGPVGAGGVGFFAVIGVVLFLSAERGNVEPETMAGALVVLAVSTTVLSLVWQFSIDPTVHFGFPARYSWLEWHPTAVSVLSLGIPTAAAAYARAVLG